MKTNHAPARKRRRKKVMEQAKGYWGERSSKYRRALETLRRAYAFAYAHRRLKKREFRALWITRLNAAVRERGMTYKTFIHRLKEKNMIFSRDVLAQIAAEHPNVFDKIVEGLQ
jgi:large subunit ribosomal protein L20